MKNIVILLLTWMLSISAVAQTRPVKEQKWFVGGHIGPTFAVADNITDHPTFKFLGKSLGLGFDVYGGTFLSPQIGCRIGVGYANVKNRGDREYVNAPCFTDFFGGDGFYHFDVFNIYADALFDFTSMCTRRERKLHVIGAAGLGLLSTGDKELYPLQGTSEELILNTLKILAKDVNGGTFLAARLSLLLDYRITDNLSINLEGDISVMNDRFDGIDYDEPVDFLLNASAGITYHF